MECYEYILDEMRNSLQIVKESGVNEDCVREKIFLHRLGKILKNSMIPKDEDVTCFIIEELEVMRKSFPLNQLEDVQDYLAELIDEIRITFFRTSFSYFFIKKKDVKIIRNDGTMVVITGRSLNIFSDSITGRTPDGEYVNVLFSDIKLRGGIESASKKERLAIALIRRKKP